MKITDFTVNERDELNQVIAEHDFNQPLRAAIENMDQGHAKIMHTVLASVDTFPHQYQVLALTHTVSQIAAALNLALDTQDHEHRHMRSVIENIIED